ncbi:ferritin [Mesotoga sp. H07pep.5.4]|uniref:ferritin-like domain-containing protein n=1 Tax=unclassified Mesotoga TaxID=1184398 RepID=UPI000C17E207|nr:MULTISPECIES: ferritin family protein [unclassified Mesotoga]PIJ62016.1 ferritin [Mesotoga sp. H07.pep.5.3]RLL88358.1 ferritin [Mesotoga sp. H07pep.5.4]
MITVGDMLDIALRIESVGYSYYQKLSEKTSGEVKSLFVKLATQEREHAAVFREMLKDADNSLIAKDWEDNVGYLKSYAEISIFPRIESIDVPDNINKAISSAVEVEKDSIIFYSDLSSFIPDCKELKDIIEEERRHLHDLVKLYGSI